MLSVLLYLSNKNTGLPLVVNKILNVFVRIRVYLSFIDEIYYAAIFE